jgi:hypothetical protein
MSDLVVRQGELAELAEQINARHAQVEASLRAGLDHARAAGELLLEAKARCEHGQWLSWLQVNVSVHPRTAQRYLLIADCRRCQRFVAFVPQRGSAASPRHT